MSVQTEEYRFLRGELDQNKRYVFERPLIIVGGALAATLAMPAKQELSFLALPFLTVLLFNLYVTLNRLLSSARIVGYLSLVHEGDSPKPWVGWENALRAYRIWSSRAKGEASPAVAQIERYDSMAFYPAIFAFHVVIGAMVALLMVAHSKNLADILSGSGDTLDVLLVVGNVACVFAFCIYARMRFAPDVVSDALESARTNWALVYEKVIERGDPEPTG